MNKILEKFNALSVLWKTVILVGVLILSFFVVDQFTNWSSDVRGWWSNYKVEQLMKENEQHEKDLKELRQQLEELKYDFVRMEAQQALIQKAVEDKKFDYQKEKNNLNKTLEELDRQAEENMKPIPDYDRCIRINEKVAIKLNCEEYR